MCTLVCLRCVYGFDSNAFATSGATGFWAEAPREGRLTTGNPSFSMRAVPVVRLRSGPRIITDGASMCEPPQSPPTGKRPTRGWSLAVWVISPLARRWSGNDRTAQGSNRNVRTGYGGLGSSGFATYNSGEHGQISPALWAGGGQSRTVCHSRGEFARNQAELAPVSLKSWGGLVWGGIREARGATTRGASKMGGIWRREWVDPVHRHGRRQVRDRRKQRAVLRRAFRWPTGQEVVDNGYSSRISGTFVACGAGSTH